MEEEVNVNFEECWEFICKRCESKNFPLVQNKQELEHVFNLMQGAESYLEIGTAEGNSLYVLAHALKLGAHITYVDIDEDRIRPKREEVVKLLRDKGFIVTQVHGNSMYRASIEGAKGEYDVVMIDAGHTFDEALADGNNYGPLAKKYVIFHDVCMPSVNNAFSLYQKETGLSAYRFINSDTFGYGILKK